MKKITGKIIPNGVYLQDHEYETLLFLTEQGFDIELIPASLEKDTKTPDMIMEGFTWEMKAPRGTGKWVIKNIMQKASHQSENVIIDIRRLKQYPQEKYISEVKQRFMSISRLRRLIIIGKRDIFIRIEK